MKSKDIRSERKVKRTYVRIGFIGILLTAGILFTILLLNSSAAGESPAKDSSTVNTQTSDATVSDAQIKKISSMTPAQRNALRKAAAERLDAVIAEAGALAEPTLVPGTDGLLVPDYFGIYPNYATSQLPTIDPATGAISGGIRKFVDSLPGLGPGGANNLGQYIPIAVADNTTYPGSDYYEIALVEYREQMHPDLTPTTLRGYVQLDTAVIPGTGVPLTNLDGTQILKGDGSQAYAVDNPHYLGPLILAQKDKPVRIKFTNFLPTGAGGDLFIPVDTTIMGAGMGPVDGEMYTQNRATLHLHGGRSPWISDGTPHQWTTPAGENTSYPEGVSVQYVPDMWFDANGNTVPAGTAGATNDPGNGSLTFYYTNQQSARLMFYHDHSYGITRLNVYAGEAAGYLLEDPVEQGLVSSGIIPADQIPLVIQDKSFVPDTTTPFTNIFGTFDSQLAAQDPTWNTTMWGDTGDLWYPHVYMTMQNPWDVSGMAGSCERPAP